MAKILACVLCVILLVASVQGCGFLDIKCKIKHSIEEAGSQLIGQAKQAFEQAMDHVFDEDISPLLDKVEAAIDAGIDKVNKDVNETINHIESSVETIIQDAAQTANALASNLTRDVEEIISKAASAMEQVEKTFYRDASNLLAQINQIVQKGQCMEAGGVKQIQDGIYKLLKALNPLYRLSSCWRSLHYKVTMTLEDLTDIQLYNYQKECTLLNKITPHTPIEGPGGILQTYAQGQLYAAEYYCIGETANAPAFQDVLSKEWLWWGVQYNSWRNIGTISKKSRHHVEADRDKGVQQLKDDPCDAPVECIAQAIKALKEAEQKIYSIQAGLSDLNRTMIATQMQVLVNQKQVNASILGLNASIVGLEANVSANARAINNTNATTNERISSNSVKLSGLTTYLCDCTYSVNYGCLCNSGVSQGYYCTKAPSNPFAGTTGMRCCQLCLGTAEEAAAYLRAHPLPAAKDPSCKSSLVPLGLTHSKLSGEL